MSARDGAGGSGDAGRGAGIAVTIPDGAAGDTSWTRVGADTFTFRLTVNRRANRCDGAVDGIVVTVRRIGGTEVQGAGPSGWTGVAASSDGSSRPSPRIQRRSRRNMSVTPHP